MAVNVKSVSSTAIKDSTQTLLSLYHFRRNGKYLPDWLEVTSIFTDDFKESRRIEYVWGRGGVEVIPSSVGKILFTLDHFRTIELFLLNWKWLSRRVSSKTTNYELYDALSLGNILYLSTSLGLCQFSMSKIPYDNDKMLTRGCANEILGKNLRVTPLHVPSVKKINVIAFSSKKMWRKDIDRWKESENICNESCHIIDIQILPSNNLDMLLLLKLKDNYRIERRDFRKVIYTKDIISPENLFGIKSSPFVLHNPFKYFVFGENVLFIDELNNTYNIIINQTIMDIVIDRFDRVFFITFSGYILLKDVKNDFIQLYPSIYWDKAYNGQDPLKGCIILRSLLDEDGELILIVRGKEIIKFKVDLDLIFSFTNDNLRTIRFYYFFETLQKFSRELRLIIDNIDYFNSSKSLQWPIKQIDYVHALNVLVRRLVRDYDSSFYGSYINRKSFNLIDEWRESIKDTLTFTRSWSNSIRIEDLQSQTWLSDLPNEIYIGNWEIFTFAIIVELSIDVRTIESAHLSVRTLKRSNSLEIKLNRNINWHNSSVTFKISLINKKTVNTQNNRTLGQNFVPLEIKFLHPMQYYIKGWAKLKTKHILNIHLDCPNSLSLYFDPELSKKELTKRSNKNSKRCWWDDDKIPCFYKNDRFYPMFTIYDWITGSRKIYEGNYTLEVIGGGSNDLGNISPFDSETLERINGENEDKILRKYSETDSLIHNNKNNDFLWFCNENSPCFNLIPDKNLRPPTYYFLIKFSNKVDRNRQCLFEMEFVVRIYGFGIEILPTGFTIILITFTILTLFLPVYLFFQSKSILSIYTK